MALQVPGDKPSPARAGESLRGCPHEAEEVLITSGEYYASPAPASGSLNWLLQKSRHTLPNLCNSEHGLPKCVPAQWAKIESQKELNRHWYLSGAQRTHEYGTWPFLLWEPSAGPYPTHAKRFHNALSPVSIPLKKGVL